MCFVTDFVYLYETKLYSMKLNVNIEYRTSWGESLDLCIGGKRYPLSYAGEGIWEAEIARITLKKETIQIQILK